jgi:hypothetical protein
LQLRPLLVGYEVFGLLGMLFLQGLMIYGVVRFGRISLRGLIQIVQGFGLIPFCWLYLRVVIWFTRKKEARMLEIVAGAARGSVAVAPTTWLRG